jgi:hypothetical protein
MRHFRDFAPDAALPNYTGTVVDYPDDALKIEVGSLTFEVDAVITLEGESEGGFYPVSALVRDAEGNVLRFTWRGAYGGVIREAVIAAVDRDWETIKEWCVERAEGERD